MKIQRLLELFDRPSEYRWTSTGPHKWVGNFYIDTGDEHGAQKVYAFEATRSFREKSWSIVFKLKKENTLGTIADTGTGDEIAVFSTVLKMLKDLIEKMNPEEIGFTASKGGYRDSRVNLYRRLIERFADTMGYYKLPDDESIHDVEFILRKKT